MMYTPTILDLVIIMGVVLVIGGMLLTPIKEGDDKPALIVVGQIGRHVAVLVALGPMFKFQVEGYSGQVKNGQLLGVIHPDGELVRYRVLQDSLKVDSDTITIKCVLLQGKS